MNYPGLDNNLLGGRSTGQSQSMLYHIVSAKEFRACVASPATQGSCRAAASVARAAPEDLPPRRSHFGIQSPCRGTSEAPVMWEN